MIKETYIYNNYLVYLLHYIFITIVWHDYTRLHLDN